MDVPVCTITPEDVAREMKVYRPLRPMAGKTSANGSVSRALAYLRPVFDWAAGRARFKKAGAGRATPLNVADISEVYDLSIDDPSLEVRRERALTQTELSSVLPLLTYPAPAGLRDRVNEAADYGPVAMMFLLLTLSRLDEVCSARKKDFDLARGIWTKKVKTLPKRGARRAGARREVSVPLSNAAIALLRSLPSFRNGGPCDLVFPSSRGGMLGNWQRTQTAIHKASRTYDWHRHDLRRTASTILRQFGSAPSVIDRLLCHASPLKGDVSAAAPAYILNDLLVENGPDPERDAVNLLAEVLRKMAPDAFRFQAGPEGSRPDRLWDEAS